MTEDMKLRLFEKVLLLERLGNTATYDNRDYFEQANGAFEMLVVLGLGTEYIRWSDGKGGF